RVAGRGAQGGSAFLGRPRAGASRPGAGRRPDAPRRLSAAPDVLRRAGADRDRGRSRQGAARRSGAARMTARRRNLTLLVLALAGGVLCVVSMMAGRVWTPLSAWIDHAAPRWPIIFELRAPRTLL